MPSSNASSVTHVDDGTVNGVDLLNRLVSVRDEISRLQAEVEAIETTLNAANNVEWTDWTLPASAADTSFGARWRAVDDCSEILSSLDRDLVSKSGGVLGNFRRAARSTLESLIDAVHEEKMAIAAVDPSAIVEPPIQVSTRRLGLQVSDNLSRDQSLQINGGMSLEDALALIDLQRQGRGQG